MASNRRLSSSQKALYSFLKECEQKGLCCTPEQMAKAARLKLGTVRTYLSKGYFSSFLTEVEEKNCYLVTGVKRLSDAEFHQEITQTQTIRDLGYNCSNPLAKALLRKSRDNMILALELYNRPSLENRLDGFVILFTLAWEQLLKARIIEEYGEKYIFRKVKAGRNRETLSLGECLEILYQHNDLVRKNIEEIKYYRDEATHLLMPELQGLLSQVFQSGVLNFAEAFRAFAHTPFVPKSSIGLFTLIVLQDKPTPAILRANYGAETASEILDLIQRVENNIVIADDSRFAITIDYSLVFTKNPQNADITLSNVNDATKEAIIISKPVDYRRSHPFFTKDVEVEVIRLLKDKLSPADLKERERADSKGRMILFNSHDFKCVVFKERWKKTDKNEFHITIPMPGSEQHQYSLKAVEFIVERIIKDKDYLTRARSYYRNRPKK